MYMYVCMFPGMGAHEQNEYTCKYVCRDQRATLPVTPQVIVFNLYIRKEMFL